MNAIWGRLRGAISTALAWKGTAYIVLSLISAGLLLPIYWTIATSFKPSAEIFRWPPAFLPQHFTLAQYYEVLVGSRVWSNIINSIVYSTVVTAFIVTIGTLTTYGFSMYPYKGSNRLAFTFLALRIIPPQILWLPFVMMYSRIGLWDSRMGVIFFDIMLSYPLAVWLLKGIFDRFPRELLDAAEVDGASRMRTLVRIVVPVVAPSVAAIAIVTFLWTWNEYMFPFLILNSQSKFPITVGLTFFISDQGIVWGPITASGVFAMLPGLIFFIFTQRLIVEGLTEGAIKQ